MDFKKLKKYCEIQIYDLNKFGYVKKDNYFFKNNGGKILAVAHLDTVLPSTHFFKNKDIIFSPVLDDRLGFYIIDYLIPKLDKNIKYDVLLTLNEERACSTAKFFYTKKNYNWMFEFDRRGTDVVLYQYHNNELVSLLNKHGFIVSTGSYSDICELSHLGISGINFGTGYYAEHQINSYAKISEIKSQIKKFINFYKSYYNIKLPKEKK